MFTAFKRHPIPVRAHFGHSLVLTYAFPEDLLTPLIPPGLGLLTYKDLGFVAIAMVQTRGLRPAFLPGFLGQDFFLSGYRVFTSFEREPGKTIRGLRILRSDTDKPVMKAFGNLLTHYNYCNADVKLEENGQELSIGIRTPKAVADLQVVADLSSRPAPLPQGSPFESLADARKFAGPLPFTFDYEKETHSIVVIKGVRKEWDPQPVAVRVLECTFFRDPRFQGVRPLLANAFYLRDVPYEWKKGVRHELQGRRRDHSL